ncbi:hypothetical protein LCGC14_1930470 [marine sediment metagenome]|uniref:Uncharacterized protein n=1 Tax=marine sediment metagenome TaxID=412755 RepID=A0A0F9IKX6_9ZZZZ
MSRSAAYLIGFGMGGVALWLVLSCWSGERGTYA